MVYVPTYSSLKTDLVAQTEDTSADLAGSLDRIIQLAEAQVLRDLDLEIFQDEFSVGNLTANNRFFAKPGALLTARSLWFLPTGGGTKKTLLKKRTYDVCNAFAPDTAVTGPPILWADIDTGNVYVVPTPDQAYPLIAYGIERPSGLSSGNQSTWLSNNAGDLLFYACLVGCEEYLVNADQVPIWKGEYADRLGKAKIELRGMSRSDYMNSRMASAPAQPI